MKKDFVYLCNINMLKRKVRQYIERLKLLESGGKTLVALSGGADSVALLRVMLDLGYACEAAHCNFHLRGEESDRDEAFVKDLCGKLHVPIHTQHFDTLRAAEEKGISIEMAARELRYGWFEELRKQTGCGLIAVAHHQDDSIETFLLNLIRGTGIKGLRGIQPKNGLIIRPLLCVSHEEILDYLKYLKQPFVTDSTNLQPDYTRNKIRLELLPMMESINPSIRQSILQTSRYMDEAYLVYNNGIEQGRNRVLENQRIDINRLLKEPSPESLLYEIIAPLGFNATQVEDIQEALHGQPGKVFESKDWQLVKDRTHLLLEPVSENEPPVLEQEEIIIRPDFSIPKDKDTACLDADKLDCPVSVRRCQTGDWFIPFGMKGRKLISDFLTDRKLTVSQKARQWLLCCGDKVVWVIGERIDNRFCVDKSTKRAIIFRKIK